MKKRIFSGAQPSGNLHIGNYLGAVRNWVKMQSEYDCVFCVVDMHAITVPQNPEILRKRVLEIAKIYMAAGIDPKESIVFIQSHVHEHAELGWILNTIARNSDLTKMTQFKDKAGLQQDFEKIESMGEFVRQFNKVGVGLYDYPVLMAADILLYGTEVVPTGRDQSQHIELARDLARRFNSQFGETFKEPQVYTTPETTTIMALDDTAKKMSKSAKSEYSYISLMDDADTVRRKMKKAVTDSGSEIKYADDKPALKNLINIYSAFSDLSPADIEVKFAGQGYGAFKDSLAEVLIGFLAPFQERFNALSDEDVLAILRDGAERARAIAEVKMKEVKERVGFIL